MNYTWKTNSWKTNQAEFFAFDKFTLQNIAKQIRGCVNQPLMHFTHEVKQYYLSYRLPTECSISQFFQDKLHSVNIQDDQLSDFSKTVKNKFQNHLYGQPVPTFNERQICSEH